MSDHTCWIYKSSRHDGLYLYLAKENEFDDLPEMLIKKMGTPTFVMKLELTSERSLAQADITKVIASISEHGYYLQIPPDLNPNLYFGD